MKTARFLRLAAIVAIGVAACAMTACGSSSAGDDSGATVVPVATVEGAAESALPVTVTSADGREVTITDASRILPLTGNISEVVFALGLGDRVVGRDVTATFAEAQGLPLVTRAHDVSAESVLSLQPTVVLASVNSGPPTAIDQIRNVGVPVVIFEEATSVDEIEPRIRAIAEAVGDPQGGEALVSRTRGELEAARSTVPAGEHPKVAFLYMRGQAGVYLIAGPGSGADSMIDAAGGVDAGTELGLDNPFTPLTSESLVAAAPDAILMTTTGLESVGGLEGLLEIPGIAQTPAGKARRVVTVEDGLLFSFGPRTAEALRELVAQLYTSGAEGVTP